MSKSTGFAERSQIVLQKAENVVGNGENAGYLFLYENTDYLCSVAFVEISHLFSNISFSEHLFKLNKYPIILCTLHNSLSLVQRTKSVSETKGDNHEYLVTTKWEDVQTSAS